MIGSTGSATGFFAPFFREKEKRCFYFYEMCGHITEALQKGSCVFMTRNGNASSVGTATHPVNIYPNYSKISAGHISEKVYSIIQEPAVGKAVISGRYGCGKISGERNTDNSKIYSVCFPGKRKPLYFSYEEIKTMLFLKAR